MSPAPHDPQPLAPDAVDATADLHRRIAALPPWAVPCVGDGGGDHVSDDPAAIDRAIAACRDCPVLAQCERFGVATRAVGVVLAGRRWTPHTGKNLRACARTKTSSTTRVEAHERNSL